MNSLLGGNPLATGRLAGIPGSQEGAYGDCPLRAKIPAHIYVLAGLILFLGCSAVLVTPKDIFPNINIPVVTAIWQYTGLSPAEMEQRITTYSEYSISSNVNDIRNIESQT